MRIKSVNIFLDFCYLLQKNIFLITDDGIEIIFRQYLIFNKRSIY